METLIKILIVIGVSLIYMVLFVAGWFNYENKHINRLYHNEDNIGQLANEDIKNDKC